MSKLNFGGHRVNILEAFNNEPAPLDFIWPGFLAGTVGTLFAPGATSKSFWAIQAAISVSGGGDTVGITPGGHGRVVYLAAEDPQPVLQHRLHAIGSRLSPESRVTADGGVDLLSLVGVGLDVGDAEQHKDLIAFCQGSRLIIIDTISRVHRLDENSNGEMAQLLILLERIARQTGAAVLFLHHISKFASRDRAGGDQFAARGAGALTDNARMGSALSRMTAGEAEKLIDKTLGSVEPVGPDHSARYVRMSIPKNNYSAPIADRWYRRDACGVLTPVDLTDIEKVAEIKKGAAAYAEASGRGAGEEEDLSWLK
ncbi:MAG: helicase RepA family protein [Acidiferrobacter thiooxydans]